MRQGGCEEAAELGLEGAAGLGGAERVDDLNGVGEEHAMAVLAGGVAQGGGEMGLAQADEAEEHDIGLFLDKAQAEEILDLQTIDLFGPVPAERVEGLEHGEARRFNAAQQRAIGAGVGFALNEAFEVGEMIAVGGGRLGGGGAAMRFAVRQLEIVQTAHQGGVRLAGWVSDFCGDGGWRHGKGGSGCRWRGSGVVAVVEREIGRREFEFEQVGTAGQVQGAGRGCEARALFEQVGDVVAGERGEFEGVLEGRGRLCRSRRSRSAP